MAAIEANLGRAAELQRGFSHKELDPVWVVAELDSHLVGALAATRALARKVEAQQRVGL